MQLQVSCPKHVCGMKGQHKNGCWATPNLAPIVLSVEKRTDGWILDSGATDHLSGNYTHFSKFEEVRRISNGRIRMYVAC